MSKEKLLYKKDIEILQRIWNDCITLEGHYVMKYVKFRTKATKVRCIFLILRIHSMTNFHKNWFVMNEFAGHTRFFSPSTVL